MVRSTPTGLYCLPSLDQAFGPDNLEYNYHKSSLNFRKDSLDCHVNCTFQRAVTVTAPLALPLPTPLDPPTHAPLLVIKNCPVCEDLIRFVPLFCGHVHCNTCFDHQTNTATDDQTTSTYFPLKCWGDGYEQSISLVDPQGHITRERTPSRDSFNCSQRRSTYGSGSPLPFTAHAGAQTAPVYIHLTSENWPRVQSV
jgi:hypothetical protein